MNFRYFKDLLLLILIVMLIIITNGCIEQLPEREKYLPPEWMKGKLFSQIQAQEDLNTFILCLKKTGYDTIIGTSGSYTVFAPTDKAFESFFQSHPDYKTMLESDEVSEELEELVKYHIIYNGWSKKQFTALDIEGWIDPKNEYDEPGAYKRKTLLYKENDSYPVKLSAKNSRYTIVDPSEASKTIKAYTQSNKYAPVFFDEYFGIYDLTGSDYEYYFNRSFHPGELYFAGAELGEEIPAENGFVYKTDKVVTPLLNGESILKKRIEGNSYEKFLKLIYQFSEFRTNLTATYEQPGADEGLVVDTLYNLWYPDLVFNIHNELTGDVNNSKNTFREHHGLLAPTDQALESFVNTYLSDWGSLDNMPISIRRIIVNSHMSARAVYPTDFTGGFFNGEGDSVTIAYEDIIQVSYGSNCSFLGLNRAIVPRVMNSVCRPIYLTDRYKVMMYAVTKTRVLSALKKTSVNYAFYLPSDMAIGLEGDSSLYRVVDNPHYEDDYHFESYDMSNEDFFTVDNDELRKQILNHITVSPPDGSANKEFLRNLGGNYVIVNHTENSVSGTAPSTRGYNGSDFIDITPELYEEETDNGEVYTINGWFKFLSSLGYYPLFLSEYPEFLDLLEKAGLYDPVLNDLPFLIDGWYYTVFIPTVEALNDYRVDTLAIDDLRELLKYHFVKGDLIFTDGKKPDGLYYTLSIDESSTPFTTKYSPIHINTNPDLIQIIDKNGDLYLDIHEEKGENNIMIVSNTDETSESAWDMITTGVIHHIDKVLIKDALLIK